MPAKLQTKFDALMAILQLPLFYNEDNKAKFQRAGLAALRALAKEMGFSEVRVSFNPGGIAVSGDHSLYGMFPDGTGVALYISQGAFSEMAGYCRSIRSLKDYGGFGPNVWIPKHELRDVERLKAKLRSVSKDKGRG